MLEAALTVDTVDACMLHENTKLGHITAELRWTPFPKIDGCLCLDHFPWTVMMKTKQRCGQCTVHKNTKLGSSSIATVRVISKDNSKDVHETWPWRCGRSKIWEIQRHFQRSKKIRCRFQRLLTEVQQFKLSSWQTSDLKLRVQLRCPPLNNERCCTTAIAQNTLWPSC